jgi:hypothetical protein
MDDKTDAEVLRELARNHAVRSKIARIRDLFDEIEATQRAGVSNKTIVAALNERGYDLGLKNFETMLHRIRLERSKKPKTETTLGPPITNSSSDYNGPAKPLHTQSSPQPTQPATPQKITNPGELRQARKRDVDLDEYSSAEDPKDG